MVPLQIVNENMRVRSSGRSSLFCMIAGPIPKSLNIPKKVIITVTTATIPNSSGAINLARIPAITNETRIPVYFAIAV